VRTLVLSCGGCDTRDRAGRVLEMRGSYESAISSIFFTFTKSSSCTSTLPF